MSVKSLKSDLNECDYFIVHHWRDMKNVTEHGFKRNWDSLQFYLAERNAIALKLLDQGIDLADLDLIVPMQESQL